MSRARLLSAALVAALASVVLVAAPAQAVTVTVSGVVRDAAGNPAPGVDVTLQIADAAAWPGDRTDASGAFSIAATQGSVVQLEVRTTDPYGGYLAISSVFGLQANRTESFSLPAPSLVTTHVVEGDDSTPAVDALVTLGGARKTASTSSGLGLTFSDFPHCGTGSTGQCTLRGFRGGSVDALWVNGSGRYSETFPGFLTPDAARSGTVVLAAAPKISGVLRDADGTPVDGATVTLVGAPRVYPTTTRPDGSWSIRSAPGGPFHLLVRGYLDDVQHRYQIESADFQHAATRTVDLTLPGRVARTVAVRASNGAGVPGASVRPVGTQSEVHVDAGGLGFDVYLNRDNEGFDAGCSTDATSRCALQVLVGGTTPGTRVYPPGGTVQEFGSRPFDPAGAEVTLALTGYATTASAGTRTGTVRARSTADVPELSAIPVSTPPGIEAVAGRIDYRIALPSGSSSAEVNLDLVLNHAANALFRQRPDGDFDEISRSTDSFTVVDGSAADADGAVNGSVSGNVVPVEKAPLTISSSELPTAAAGKPYATRLEATGPGGPFRWSVDPRSDPLPPGLTLSPDGLLSGTAPVPADYTASYTFLVAVQDSRGWNAPVVRYLHLNVDKIAVLTSSVPDGYVGGTYSTQLQQSGAVFPSWQLYASTLPPGLKLSSTGTISGVPTVAGRFPITVWVKGSNGSSRFRDLVITIKPMEVATAALPDAPIGAAYSQKLVANGGKGTKSWSVVGGALPAGMSLSAAGAISGRPTTLGTYSVTVKVTDQSVPKQTATRTLTITVTPMEITTSALPDGKKGTYYAFKLAASGGKPTLAWSVVGGSLPTGLTLSSAGNISGYPKAPGTWTFTVRVLDASTPKNQALRTLSITILA